ncbi:SGNH/GDSL hydrolase family protein [Kitasatospora sp. NPDC088160]|uniref:SGNH/GDSL hydrolase family protein n=1 Tax=Kitasatospora sp. NPDC088160 TaxID=3364072 RepID=UPI0038015BBD
MDSYLDDTCHRSAAAYPSLFAQQTAPASFSFQACGGAVTTDVPATQLAPLSPTTTLVSLTVGGNDVDFKDVMRSCQFGGDNTCVGAVDTAEQTARTQLPARLDAVYSAVRERASGARVVVTGYPRFFNPASPSLCAGMGATKRAALNRGADTLNSVIEGEVAKCAGFVYQDVATLFAGHELCDAAPFLNGLILNSGSYHPNAAGQANGYLPALRADL